MASQAQFTWSHTLKELSFYKRTNTYCLHQCYLNHIWNLFQRRGKSHIYIVRYKLQNIFTNVIHIPVRYYVFAHTILVILKPKSGIKNTSINRSQFSVSRRKYICLYIWAFNSENYPTSTFYSETTHFFLEDT